MTGFADIRRKMRREVHAAFSVSATYQDSVVVLPVPLGVRWHDKSIRTIGNIQDYAGVLDSVDKIVFSSEELATLGITPKRDGVVKLTEFNNYQMVLDSRDPSDGPLKIVWAVKRPQQVTGF